MAHSTTTSVGLAPGALPVKVDGRAREAAKLRVIRGYDSAIIRAYCWGRFGIRHQRFLDEIGQYLPSGGRVLDLSCGFGLFSLYYANVLPNLHQDGLDRSSRRFATACRAAERLGVRPTYKRWFTHVLDKPMDPRSPVRYWRTDELQGLLEEVGCRVYRHLMVDVLPYPHVLYINEKHS